MRTPVLISEERKMAAATIQITLSPTMVMRLPTLCALTWSSQPWMTTRTITRLRKSGDRQIETGLNVGSMRPTAKKTKRNDQ